MGMPSAYCFTECSFVPFRAEVNLTAARKGLPNSEMNCLAKWGVRAASERVLFARIFMTSRDFDFGTAIWDYRFSESIESLLSPVHIASNERFLRCVVSPSTSECGAVNVARSRATSGTLRVTLRRCRKRTFYISLFVTTTSLVGWLIRT